MQTTIVIPNNNEEALIERALELSYEAIVFLYKKEIKNYVSDRIKSYTGLLIGAKSPSEIGKLANKFYKQADLIAVTSQNENIIRAAFENNKVDFVFGICTSSGREHTHYRYSNFNNVLAELAKQNKIAYGVDFSYLLNSEGVARAKLLGREMQNVYLARRKTKIIISSFTSNPWEMRRANDLQALLQLMGLDSKQANQAISTNISDILEKKQGQRSKEYVREGVRVVE